MRSNSPNDAVATRIVKLIDELFESMRWHARRNSITPHAMSCVRRGQNPWWRRSAGSRGSPPILACLRVRWEGGELHALAVEKLTRFLEHAELELSNNLAENSMRPVALGRKNWIHVGSQKAAEGGGDSVHRGELPPDEDSDP